jgi:hypothetical protein
VSASALRISTRGQGAKGEWGKRQQCAGRCRERDESRLQCTTTPMESNTIPRRGRLPSRGAQKKPSSLTMHLKGPILGVTYSTETIRSWIREGKGGKAAGCWDQDGVGHCGSSKRWEALFFCLEALLSIVDGKPSQKCKSSPHERFKGLFPSDKGIAAEWQHAVGKY